LCGDAWLRYQLWVGASGGRGGGGGGWAVGEGSCVGGGGEGGGGGGWVRSDQNEGESDFIYLIRAQSLCDCVLLCCVSEVKRVALAFWSRFVFLSKKSPCVPVSAYLRHSLCVSMCVYVRGFDATPDTGYYMYLCLKQGLSVFVYMCLKQNMGWLRLVGSLKL